MRSSAIAERSDVRPRRRGDPSLPSTVPYPLVASCRQEPSLSTEGRHLHLLEQRKMIKATGPSRSLPDQTLCDLLNKMR